VFVKFLSNPFFGTRKTYTRQFVGRVDWKYLRKKHDILHLNLSEFISLLGFLNSCGSGT
jgi:hypothetical protein